MGLLAAPIEPESPIEPRVNGAGRICKPGVTGKFYCGGPLGVPCSCCNGYCGPTDGCSCVFCMREDIRVRHLREGFLVNKEGRTCGVSKATGRLYCGAKFARRRTASAEGMYCRPEPTAQCLACEVLERQLAQRGGRYESIVREWATYTIRTRSGEDEPRGGAGGRGTGRPPEWNLARRLVGRFPPDSLTFDDGEDISDTSEGFDAFRH